ncbi:TetR/AcrR family transcriptional regulator [bacterium]|nr:TetR/AcrR family transcriptional regulator [bacterium]
MDTAECVDLNNKRERILNAAIKAFSSQGFYRTRITDIARAAKVADGTVYLYFESKEQLLAAIFNESMKSFMDMGRKEVLEVEDVEERLLLLLKLHLENIGKDRELATVFQVEMRHSAHFMKETSRAELREYLMGIQQVIEQGKDSGKFRADLDSWFVAKSIFALLDEAATNWVLSETDDALEDEATRIMDFILRGMK